VWHPWAQFFTSVLANSCYSDEATPTELRGWTKPMLQATIFNHNSSFIATIVHVLKQSTSTPIWCTLGKQVSQLDLGLNMQIGPTISLKVYKKCHFNTNHLLLHLSAGHKIVQTPELSGLVACCIFKLIPLWACWLSSICNWLPADLQNTLTFQPYETSAYSWY